MKKLLLLVLVLAAAGYVALTYKKPVEPVFTLEEGYRFLYSGESLQGWRAVGGKATFEADGESIIGRRGPGANTFLRTEETFGDFSLKLQMRWDEPGNSGVMFRARQRNGDGRVYGYQYELDPSERSWTGGIYDEARRGWLANLEDKPDVRAAIRPDDWNEVEIEARGTRLKTWINGVPAVEVVDGLDARGFIALQVHSGKTGAIRWRNIRIKELPPARAEGDSLMSSEEWRTTEPRPLQFSTDGLGGGFSPGDGFITSRRQFSEAMVRMTVPACDSPTVIRMRDRPDSQKEIDNFAEVKIYRDRAEARLVTAQGERILDPVKLKKADQHEFVGISLGGSITFTVGETDVLRLNNTGLSERGRLRIQPARCGDTFSIEEFAWFSLREKSAEPLFYQTLETPPAPVLSPEEALAAFRVAPGFEVELVAAEPLVEDPVAMAWDEYGRLYVVELRGYMRDAYGTGGKEPVGQVVRLEDTDNDGRMDTSEVFLGELVSARAVAVVNEGVLIGEPPHLWLCELPTRDALCDSKRRIGNYATDVDAANVEHMENGLRPGLDNWLYNSKSARSLRIEAGELVEREGLQRGQWGITRDDVGRLLYNHNSTWIQADFFAGEDLVQAGRGGFHPGLGVNLTAPASVYSVRVNPGVNRAYLPKTLREDGRLANATGVSGLVAYRGDQFPDQYRGDVFVPESAGNVVAQFALEEEGIGLKATQRLYDDEQWGQRDFLGSTDERFRPVDAMNGPDGALYIIDMYRGIIQDDHFLTDELREQIFQRELDAPIGKGRIWRVRHIEGRPGRDMPDLGNASGEELVAALTHANGWVRDTAQRLLLKNQADVTAQLIDLARGEDTVAALHAVWTLQGRGELQRDLVIELASNANLHRQVQVLRAGRGQMLAADLLNLHEQLQQSSQLQYGGPASQALAMQLAFAMGDHTGDQAVRSALGQLLAEGVADPYIRQAVVRALSGRELQFLDELFNAGVALDRGKESKMVLQMLAGNAYRSLRGDLSDTGSANPELLDLLALVASRDESDRWQQVGLLKGLELVARSPAFVPAMLEGPPPIFADATLSEESPLWSARLGARSAFTWPGDELALGLKPLTPSQLEEVAAGEAFFPRCAACHGEAGEGVAGLAPPLAGAEWVTGPPEWLARIILQGMSGPVEVQGQHFDGVMPPHGHMAELDDVTLAGLMTYLRRSWGNKAEPVSVESVAAIRAASAAHETPWTAEELRAVPYDRGYKRFEGKFSISFVTFTFTDKPDGLHVEVPMYGAGKMDVLGPTRFGAAAGGEDVEIEFVVEPDGSVNSLVLHRKGEEIKVKRKH